MDNKIRILIADGNEEFCEHLKRVLDQSARLEVVGIANDGARAAELLGAKQPDLLVLDLMLAKLDGISVLKKAAAMDKPTLFYLPDDDRYRSENGVNIDLFQAMPRCTFTEQEDLFRVIDSGAYPMEDLREYKRLYLPQDLGHATEKIAELILQDDRVQRKEAAVR